MMTRPFPKIAFTVSGSPFPVRGKPYVVFDFSLDIWTEAQTHANK
jgi:hypothetical protein